MVAIASYHASVGVKIDNKGLKQVDSYLKGISRKMKAFEKSLGRTKSFKISLDIDYVKTGANIQRAVNRLSRSGALKLKIHQFDINQAALKKAVSTALGGVGGGSKTSGVRVGARLSQESLMGMKMQLRNSLSNMTINPRINPRVSPGRQPRGSGGSPQPHREPGGKGARHSPYYNPMMVGGGLGAFTRYGLFSLPFFGGVLGINALAQNAQMLQGQRIALDMTAGEKVGADGTLLNGAHYAKYLDTVGAGLGKKTSDMMPFFTQMLAGAMGTDLEPHLEEGFKNLMQYSTVMGLDGEQTKGAIRAFSQMIGKQQIMAEELRGQAAEHLPPIVRMMAEAITGGDVKKLNKMMEMGQLDPNKHLKPLWDMLGQVSSTKMPEYLSSLRFQTSESGRLMEEWRKLFFEGGATEGMTSVMESFNRAMAASMPNAERLGEIFGGIAKIFAGGMLLPQEWMEFLNNKGSEDNAFNMLFKDTEMRQAIQSVNLLISEIKGLFDSLKDDSGWTSFRTQLNNTTREIRWIANEVRMAIAEFRHMAQFFSILGSEGIGQAMKFNRDFVSSLAVDKESAKIDEERQAMGLPPMTPEEYQARRDQRGSHEYVAPKSSASGDSTASKGNGYTDWDVSGYNFFKSPLRTLVSALSSSSSSGPPSALQPTGRVMGRAVATRETDAEWLARYQAQQAAASNPASASPNTPSAPQETKVVVEVKPMSVNLTGKVETDNDQLEALSNYFTKTLNDGLQSVISSTPETAR